LAIINKCLSPVGYPALAALMGGEVGERVTRGEKKRRG
jgi:hypothetical protein